MKKFQKHFFSWKENFLNKVPKKIFFRKKFTEKNSLRKHISKLIFFTNSILQKKSTKIFLNWKKKKKKSRNFNFNFQITEKKSYKKSRLKVG